MTAQSDDTFSFHIIISFHKFINFPNEEEFIKHNFNFLVKLVLSSSFSSFSAFYSAIFNTSCDEQLCLKNLIFIKSHFTISYADTMPFTAYWIASI